MPVPPPPRPASISPGSTTVGLAGLGNLGLPLATTLVRAGWDLAVRGAGTGAPPLPVLGVVDGPAVGGGLGIAACCDVLVATDRPVFGVPIARTLGNCLAPAGLARLQRRLGVARTMAMLLTARTIDAQEAAAAGFVHAVVAPTELDAAADELTRRLAAGAARTLAGLKEFDRRLAAADGSGAVDADDVLVDCYGSTDFEEGVAAFVQRRRPTWTGR